ncbi:MAG: MATE family efflux transporter [Lachnospiraceae bacterium]|nr:MATE family efflux transporter [Lachnospiraceae bacterium]
MNKDHMFSNNALKKLLIPIIIEQLLSSLIGTVDTMMVSNVGDEAMSAVSLVNSINVLVMQAFSALATGGVIVCSQYIGKKDDEMANKAAGQLLFSVGFLSVIVMSFCLIFRTGLLGWIFGSVEEAVMENSKTYLFYTALSFPFIAVYNSGAAIFRAQGVTKMPMKISIISNLINVCGNAIFIWVFHWEVMGVALATLISRVFSAVVVLYFLRQPKQTIVVKNYHKIRPDFRIIKTVLRIGIPSGVENSMFQLGKLMIQSTVSTMGTAAIAGQAMTSTLESLQSVAASSVGVALTTVVGQCIGASRRDEAKYYVKKMSVWSWCILVTSCIIVLILVRPVTILAGMEPESAKICVSLITTIVLVKPFIWVPSFTFVAALRAGGDVKYTMVTAIISMWICRVVLCIFLVRQFDMGPLAVWIGMFSDWTMRGIFFGTRLRSGKWLKHKVIE